MNITARRSRRRAAALLAWCLLLLACWALWTWRLGAGGLTQDEAISFHWATRPLPQLVSQLQGAAVEHPPTYYVLLHGWMRLAGESEYGLRLPSVMIGVVSVALTGWLARRVMPAAGAIPCLVPALLLVVLPGMVYNVRLARMYSLVVALPLVSSLILVRGFLHKDGWPRWTSVACLALVHALAVTTHYYLVLPIVAQPLPLVVSRKWKALLAWCTAQVVPVLAVLAWFLLSPGLRMTTNGVRPTIVIPTRFELTYLLGKLLFSPVARIRYVLLYVLIIMAALGTVFVLWRNRAVGTWLFTSLVCAPALAFVIPRIPPPRYVLFVLPTFALALGALCVAPLASTHSRWRVIAVVASAGLTLPAAWLMARTGLTPALNPYKSHYGRTLETVSALSKTGDVLLFYGPWQELMLEYYDPGGLPPIVTIPKQAPPRLKRAEAEPLLRGLVENFGRIWVLPAAVADVDPDFVAGEWLASHAHNVWETGDFGLYLPPLPVDAPAEDSELPFGDAIRLRTVQHQPMPIPAGEPLRFTLVWDVLRSIRQHVQTTVSLVDQTGHVWAIERRVAGHWADATDTWSPGRVVTERAGLIVPLGAPPGTYAVRLMVSDLATGEPLLTNGAGEAAILTVSVAEPIRSALPIGLPEDGRVRFCAPSADACVELLGVEPGGKRFQQGQAVPYKLHWVAEGLPDPGLVPHLSALHDPPAPWARDFPIYEADIPSPWSYADGPGMCRAGGTVVSPAGGLEVGSLPHRVMLPMLLSASACTRPLAGRLVTTPGAFVLPPDAHEGRARVVLSLLDSDGQAWSTSGGDTAVRLFTIDVESRPTLRKLPGDLSPVSADFAEAVSLRGYRVDGSFRPGGQLRITLGWHVLERPTQIFSVFNHLTTPDGTLVAQADGWPLEGRILTTQWQPGEYLRDSHVVEIPADAPPGPYRLLVGLYDAATGVRPAVVISGEVQEDGWIEIPLPARRE